MVLLYSKGVKNVRGSSVLLCLILLYFTLLYFTLAAFAKCSVVTGGGSMICNQIFRILPDQNARLSVKKSVALNNQLR